MEETELGRSSPAKKSRSSQQLYLHSKDHVLQNRAYTYEKKDSQEASLDDSSFDVAEMMETAALSSQRDMEELKQTSTGSLLGMLTTSAVVVLDTETLQLKFTTAEKTAVVPRAFEFSPKATFLITCAELTKESKASAAGNLLVWNLNTSELKLELIEKFFLGGENWPLLKWSQDEKYCVHRVRNALHVHDMEEEVVVSKVPFEGVLSFDIPLNPFPEVKEGAFHVAVFKPEHKAQPGVAAILSTALKQDESCTPTMRASKALFRVQEAKFKWSPLCTHCLIKTEAAEDVTGKSYYGESNLHLLSLSACFNIALKDGGVKDFCWSPKGREFVVISGTVPSLICLYNLKGEAVFKFGELHRNTCLFNSFGRFLCIAGFGNLPGDMDFWDLSRNNTAPLRIGGNNANCPVTYGWSPDGRTFMIASLYPRRRVDNGIQLFTYSGKKIYDERYGELYDVQWKAAAPGAYGDRPRSRDVREQKQVSTKKKYVPPHMRGKVSENETTSTLNGEGSGASKLKEREAGPSKSQIRRLRKIKAKEKERQKQAELLKEQEKQEQEKQKEQATNSQPLSEVDEKKKTIRKLAKQLKGITLLEQKLNNGEELNEAQQLKLTKKEALEKQLAELQ